MARPWTTGEKVAASLVGIAMVSTLTYVLAKPASAAQSSATPPHGTPVGPATQPQPTPAQLSAPGQNAFVTYAQVSLVAQAAPQTVAGQSIPALWDPTAGGQLNPPYSVADETGVADVRFKTALSAYQTAMGLPNTSGTLDQPTYATLSANSPNS